MGGTTENPQIPDAPSLTPEGQESTTKERPERERRRELHSLSDTVAKERAEKLLGKDPSKTPLEKLFDAEEKEEGVLAYTFNSGIEREIKTKESRDVISKNLTLKEDFHEGDVLTVDFKSNTQAEWNIGAGDLLPPTVRQITVTNPDGTVRTSTRRLGLKGGFFDSQGYIPIFSGYKIAVTKIWTEEERAALRKPNGKWDRKKYEEKYDAEDQTFAKQVYQETYHEEWKGSRIDAETLQRMQKKSGLERGESLSTLLQRKPHYKEAASAAANLYGVPQNVIFAFIKHESGFNEFAVNRSSNASGLGQFIDDTWKSFIKAIKNPKHKDHALYVKLSTDPEWGTRNPLEWRFNPEANIHATAWYTEQNGESLGVHLDDAFNLYMAHHEGAGGYQAYQRYKKIAGAHPDWSTKKCGTEARLAWFQMKRIDQGNDPFGALEAYARQVANSAGQYNTELGNL